ncbi:MAG: hypothetical protein JWM81_890 [Candidatus Saccharibacteria bacterium]|nr:hypothetical protein [Candidatus Saccharibacteria bacterium]
MPETAPTQTYDFANGDVVIPWHTFYNAPEANYPLGEGYFRMRILPEFVEYRRVGHDDNAAAEADARDFMDRQDIILVNQQPLMPLLGEVAYMRSVHLRKWGLYHQAYALPTPLSLNTFRRRLLMPIGGHDFDIVAAGRPDDKPDGMLTFASIATSIARHHSIAFAVSAGMFAHDSMSHGMGLACLSADTMRGVQSLFEYGLSHQSTEAGMTLLYATTYGLDTGSFQEGFLDHIKKQNDNDPIPEDRVLTYVVRQGMKYNVDAAELLRDAGYRVAASGLVIASLESAAYYKKLGALLRSDIKLPIKRWVREAQRT